MEQQAEAIVLEVAHPVGHAPELLGDQVLGLAPGVRAPGGEVVEDLGLPALDGLGQPDHLWGPSVGRQLVEEGELGAGGGEGRLGVHRP